MTFTHTGTRFRTHARTEHTKKKKQKEKKRFLSFSQTLNVSLTFCTFNRRAERRDNTTRLSGPTHTSMCKHTRLCTLINNSTVSVHTLPNTFQQECLHPDTHTLTHTHAGQTTHSCHEGQITKSIKVTQNRSLHYTAAVVRIDWELFTSHLGCVQIRVRLKPSLLQSNFSLSTCLKRNINTFEMFQEYEDKHWSINMMERF